MFPNYGAQSFNLCIIQRVQPLDNHQDRYTQMIHPSHCCYVTEDGSGEEDRR